MQPRPNRTAEGQAATDVVLETFRANGGFLGAGDLLASAVGLTSARWQVLGALGLAGRPLTVPQIARRMGLTRQSVQATVKQLLAEALVEPQENPDHKRSPLIRPTELGHEKYADLDRRQISWINGLAAGLNAAELTITAGVLRQLTSRLNTNAQGGEGRSDRYETP
ncbi:MAG TPA: MarR family transcriptional regulator [Solirubrobacteraceae bacterium]|nr:MarR family transcriptional regulator [Solirubrobacteraceae bacterium]HME04417.1 MarR family transcriptional regulator [Solirubrobacteraceae bacterium]